MKLMKGIIIGFYIILFLYLFQYIIYINYKFNKSILKNKTKQIINITVRSLLSDERTSIELEEYSGLYSEVSSIEKVNTNNKYNIEDIYFLLTTHTKRIRHTIDLINFWSKIDNIKCIIVFEENDYLNTEKIEEYLIDQQIKCEIKTSNIKHYEERYFYLIKFGWNYIKEFSWFAIADDDTIWFINNLLKILQQYNSSKLIYLGNISERNQSIQRHGNYFAYGGAGILLSKPLVQLISTYYEKCQKEFYNENLGGDIMIGKCITQFLFINLTINKHFHQIDFHGDIHGFLQSGIDGLVSIHHIFSLWEPFPEEHSLYEKDIINILQSAYKKFQLDFLKRFFKINFKTNQTLLLTIGYSFTIFNRILSLDDLNKIEMTWDNTQLYQIRTRPKEINKINWFFKQLTNQNSTTAIYQYNKKQIQIIFNN